MTNKDIPENRMDTETPNWPDEKWLTEVFDICEHMDKISYEFKTLTLRAEHMKYIGYLDFKVLANQFPALTRKIKSLHATIERGMKDANEDGNSKFTLRKSD